MKSDNVIQVKSFDFAVRIVKFYKHLTTRETNKEFVLSKQVLRSGTSIGANVSEAIQAASKPDFIAKLNISLKEAYETSYWLKLLYHTDYIVEKEYISISADCQELIKLLTAILKTSKNN